MKHYYYANYNGIILRPLWKCDLEDLRRWRNDKELSKFLTPIQELTTETQIRWYEDYLENEDILFFAVVDHTEGKTIGSVALYGFHDKTCEVGKIVIGDASERGKGIGYYSLLMVMCIGIQYLEIDLFKLKVCEDNCAAYSMYKKAGFEEIARHPFIRGGIEIEMRISKENFERQNHILNDIYIYSGSDEILGLSSGG